MTLSEMRSGELYGKREIEIAELFSSWNIVPPWLRTRGLIDFPPNAQNPLPFRLMKSRIRQQTPHRSDVPPKLTFVEEIVA